MGLVYPKMKVDEGEFGKKDIITFNIYQIIANAFAWIIVAPVLDIVISNAVSAGVIGSILLVLYSKTRSKKGSLTKES